MGESEYLRFNPCTFPKRASLRILESCRHGGVAFFCSTVANQSHLKIWYKPRHSGLGKMIVPTPHILPSHSTLGEGAPLVTSQVEMLEMDWTPMILNIRPSRLDTDRWPCSLGGNVCWSTLTFPP